ncbi:bifunctional adenosylcobinamide kinase/adenosylcobinamide-phosphate guanylyltransferase [Coralliovum pocilloporae]|uniref:bifunctional adenosylcobinamide kinase/adenosylcobinamide-phosphate guanylyltransferase n=1 Tax=Coralliovum pocilloporae TaxID=3066369 RepID=UPI003307A5C9
MIQSSLVLGGARSGKSQFAEDLILRSGLSPVYLATGTVGDGEMAERVKLHKDRRGAEWHTIEEPINLLKTLKEQTASDKVFLVDCLTFWLFNLMEQDIIFDEAVGNLCEAIPQLAGPVVFVSNEVGLSIVPENALARRFRDNQGRVNRLIAEVCERVVLVVAGQPLQIKPQPHAEIIP